MKHSFLKKGALIFVGLLFLAISGANAQSKVYKAEDIVKDKLEAIQSKLDLSAEQVDKIKAIDKETEKKLDAAADNTAAKKVYKWRDGEYKKVLTAEQFKKYLKEQEAIVDEAQAAWSQSHATVISK